MKKSNLHLDKYIYSIFSLITFNFFITSSLQAQGSLASSGTGYTWTQLLPSDFLSDASKVATPQVNDGDSTVTYSTPDVDNDDYYQGVGIIWNNTLDGISKFEFKNGVFASISNDNGVFAANLMIQVTNDGTTWNTVSGWNVSPSYPYTSLDASNKSYMFSGPAVNNILGIRLVGQLRLSSEPYGATAWAIKVREVNVFVGVSSISLTPLNTDLFVGESTTITSTVLPSNADNKIVEFTSTNPTIASVNVDGVVNAISEGSVTITGRTLDGGFTAFSTINVNTISLTGFSLSPSSLSLGIGDQSSIVGIFTPSNASNKLTFWTSSNSSIVDVNSLTGIVTGVSVGNATITGITQEGSFSASSVVTVNAISVTGISISSSSSIITIGSSATLTGVVTPVNATNKTVFWSSSNVSVASINSLTGVLNALSAGIVTITGTTEDANFTDIQVITIREILVSNMVISVSSSSVFVGEVITFSGSVSPINATNKSIIWTSSSASILSINSITGVATANSVGVVTITGTSESSSISRNLVITVSSPIISVSGVSITATTVTSLIVGQTLTLVGTVSPANATNPSINWNSSNSLIASVNSLGVVSALRAGSVTITASSFDGSKSASISFTITSITGSITGITNLSFESVNIYPNPFIGYFNIDGDEVVSIYDALGNLIIFNSDLDNRIYIDKKGLILIVTKSKRTFKLISE